MLAGLLGHTYILARIATPARVVEVNSSLGIAHRTVSRRNLAPPSTCVLLCRTSVKRRIGSETGSALTPPEQSGRAAAHVMSKVAQALFQQEQVFRDETSLESSDT